MIGHYRDGGWADYIAVPERNAVCLPDEISFEHGAVLIWKANDWFAYAESAGIRAVPAHGRLVRAAFDIYFTGQAKPRPVHVRAGNKLRLARHCDAAAVHRWLTERGFRSGESEAVNRITGRDANLVGRN